MRQEYAHNDEAELRAATVETELYKNLGNTELAEKALNKMIDYSQRLAGKIPKDLQLDIVKTYFLNDQHDKAEQILDGLIKNHIEDDGFLNDVRRMQTSIGMDNHSEVLIQKTKQTLIATNNQGVALFKQGRCKEALELFEKAMLAMPENKTITLNILKILVFQLKTGEVSEERVRRAKALFLSAKQIGVDQHKLAKLLSEFAEISRQRYVANET